LKLLKKENTLQSFCDMSSYYFAFGSNMNKERMIEREVEFNEIEMQKGFLKDWKLVFNKINVKKDGSGYANIEPDSGSIVEGIIYKTNEDGIKKLDWNEGVRFDSYRQKEMLIENKNNESINCIVYIANHSKTDNSRKPEKWYLNHLLKGGKYLSENYFTNLKNIEILE